MKRPLTVAGIAAFATVAFTVALVLPNGGPSSTPPAPVVLPAHGAYGGPHGPVAGVANETVTDGLPTPGTFISPPSAGGNLCNYPTNPDTTAQWNAFFATHTSGTVVLPHDACYTISGTITINGASGLTIDGNGATFNQWPPYCPFLNTSQTATAVTSNTITVPSPGQLCVGNSVSGHGLGGNAKITNITGHVVTLSHVTGTLTTSSYTFTNTDSFNPVIFLELSSNVAFTDLNLAGAWDGTSGTSGPCGCSHGDNTEGKVGLMLQADNTVTAKNIAIVGVQGDGFSVQIPSEGAAAGTGILNKAVTFSNNVETSCGWVCLSVESVNGLTYTNNVVASNSGNVIDFELDGASTAFGCQSCAATYAAQNNILIARNTFSAFGQFFFTSLQGGIEPNAPHVTCPANGSGPPLAPNCTYHYVQQHNVTITANTILCNPTGPNVCPLMQVVGTNANLPAPYGQTRALNNGLTITNNVLSKGAGGSTNGGSGCVANSGSAMVFKNILNLTVTGNVFPMSTTGFVCSPFAYVAGLQASHLQGNSRIQNNTFLGGASAVNPSSSSLGGAECGGNVWGINGNQNDNPPAPC